MALVAYENSDSSDYEDDDSENAIVVTLNKKEEPSAKPAENSQVTTEEEQNDSGPSLFNFLPQPSNKISAIVEEDDEFLHKKDNVPAALKPKAKITVPSLSDFKDVESTAPTAKPRATNGKKSGLLSMLPQPRHAVTATTKSMIPHVLTQRPSNSTVKKKPLPTTMKKSKDETKILNEYSDDSDNDGEPNDFFSINKPVDLPIEDIPLDIDEKETNVSKPSEKKEFNIESYFKPDTVENHEELQPEQDTSSTSGYDVPVAASSSYSNGYVTNEASGSSNNEEVVLDDEAIMKLCGSRGKRKREEIQIVDINQQEVLADAREWLLKGLMDDTTKRVSASKKKGNEPTSQQRRKHQITYLAHQAKANEAELQNQWANNRMSKRQTQSKYGF